MAKSKKSKASTGEPMCCGPSKADQEKWKVEDGCRALKQAQEVTTDKMLLGKCRKKLEQDRLDIGKILKGAR